MIARTVKLKPNHMLNDEDQLTTLVKIIPSEVSPLWQEESYVWRCSHNRDSRQPFLHTNSTFDENSSYNVSYLVSEIRKDGKTIKTN